MAGNSGIHVLTDAQWAVLEPLIDEVRPHCKVPHDDLRQTISAILWRHQNGAKWRSLAEELGPWWKAAQTFIRWARLGVWERLLDQVQQRGIALGMTGLTASEAVPRTLDGTHVRAHQKASGAEKRGPTARSATAVRRLAALVAAMVPRPA
jgi:transposase